MASFVCISKILVILCGLFSGKNSVFEKHKKMCKRSIFVFEGMPSSSEFRFHTKSKRQNYMVYIYLYTITKTKVIQKLITNTETSLKIRVEGKRNT
jgi:hypothetical protein